MTRRLSAERGALARRFSALGALLVAVSFALPFYTCTHHVDANGEAVEVEEGAPLPPGVTAVVETTRPIEGLDLTDPETWPLAVAFLWPLALVGARALWPRLRALGMLSALEALLIAGSGWVFQAYSSVGDRAWGAYVAFVGLAIYAGAFVAGVVPRIRGWLERRAAV